METVEPGKTEKRATARERRERLRAARVEAQRAKEQRQAARDLVRAPTRSRRVGKAEIARLLDLLRGGDESVRSTPASVASACREVGISASWVYQRIEPSNPQYDEAFAHAFREIMMDRELTRVGEVENALFETAVVDRSIAAQKFYLVNRAPDRWADEKTVSERGGPSGMSGEPERGRKVELTPAAKAELRALAHRLLVGEIEAELVEGAREVVDVVAVEMERAAPTTAGDEARE